MIPPMVDIKAWYNIVIGFSGAQLSKIRFGFEEIKENNLSLDNMLQSDL